MAQLNYDRDYFYDALIRSTDDYIYLCDMKNDIFLFSPSMVEDFNLPGTVVPHGAQVWAENVHEQDLEKFNVALMDMIEGRTNVHNVEYRVKNCKGEWVWVRCKGYLEYDDNNEQNLFAGIVTNLSKRNKIDHLSGLFNKFEFENDLNEAIQKEENLSIMILGLDDFKHINDLHERTFGDEVLHLYAQRIQSLLDKNTQAYRLDGDEFGVLMKNGNEEKAVALFKRIQAEFDHQQELNNLKYYCTVSSGCTQYPKDGKTFDTLYKCAEYSLEYSKNSGKNRLSFYNREIMREKSRNLELTELLRYSVEHNYVNFELNYQPQVDALTKKLKGAEALARWSCEKYGAVSPVEFIPLLEDSGLIIPVGKWIFKEAVKTCKEWQSIKNDFVMNINLSYIQLIESDFIQFMKDTIDENQLDPSHIILELTESCIASGSACLIEAFTEIRALGFKIAMDDFGTGYSSLEILKNAPTDVVKIARVFVQDILYSNFDAAFIKFVVALCHDVNIEICLEGVETEAEYSAVSTMNLDLIQGFLFGKPQCKKAFYEQFIEPEIIVK